ncbi:MULTISPECIES: hypothetical protein [unclassified Cobetia]|uniref:hypothetical protein n=1 Tax=unclassified Cobetia TaxID=2609414 RepID=UPI00178CEAF7|nr:MULTISPECIES: hypothetical protein [unclassified Cobetia]MBE2167459.1 hypothetical protein [Cobetia sp. 2AS1]MDH2447096.1 hypothetical protein [Cobetia sp. 2AS]
MTESNDELLDYREMHYARMCMKDAHRFLTFVLSIGLGSIIVSIAYVTFISSIMPYIGWISWLSYAIASVFFVFGIMMVYASCYIRPELSKQKTKLSGILKRQIIYNAKGKNGEIFFVGETQIFWPYGGAPLCYPDINSHVVVEGVAIREKRNNHFLFRKKAKLVNTTNKDISTFIVLNYGKYINISALLDNYGLGYFKERFWFEVKKDCIVSLPILAATAWFLFSGIYFLWSVAVLVATIVGSIFVAIKFDSKLEVLFGKKTDYRSASHLQRLSGKLSNDN